MSWILALDQGTTSTRAVLFDAQLRPQARAQRELTQYFPAPGHVEHDAVQIWHDSLACLREVLAGISPTQVAALGITNQRETLVIWDRATGAPIHRAIVWQDRRTAPMCAALRQAGHEALITARTGLLLDPYFSASKAAFILDQVPGARMRAERGELALGTIDSWLIWNLTGGRVHATDVTNAARTLLFDIGRNAWDADLCALFDIPMAMLPEVRDCAAGFGQTAPGLLGAPVPLRGVAGDQQAATMGQACFTPGMMKATYGTGCFALLNTGARRIVSQNRLLTTIAWRLDGQTTWALEGSIFVAGAVVQWLRDGLGIIDSAAGAGDLAAAADPVDEVLMVPAFTGLGAPYWRPDCRGAIFGLTRGTGRAAIARAALESVGFQTRDLLAAMQADWRASHPGDPQGLSALRVDGGMAGSDMTMQFLADILGAAVERPVQTEATVLGVAWLAGLQAGLCRAPGDFAPGEGLAGPMHRFVPRMDAGLREARYTRWQRAVRAVMTL